MPRRQADADRNHLLGDSASLRLRYEYLLILRVRGPVGTLSRFFTDDHKEMSEGRERCEAVLRALREAGLTYKLKRHATADGSKLLFVFVHADTARLEQQSQRLSFERWLQEEGIGGTMGHRGSEMPQQVQMRGAVTRPTMRVVRVGGLHYFAPAEGAEGNQQPQPRASQPPPRAAPPPPGEQQQQPTPAHSPRFAPSSAGRVELLAHILRTPASQGGAGLDDFEKADRRGTLQHCFPLHDQRFNWRLRRQARWLNPFWGASRDRFLEDVRGHFGEKVAFYFAFNCFYTRWLLPPIVVGCR